MKDDQEKCTECGAVNDLTPVDEMKGFKICVKCGKDFHFHDTPSEQFPGDPFEDERTFRELEGTETDHCGEQPDDIEGYLLGD